MEDARFQELAAALQASHGGRWPHRGVVLGNSRMDLPDLSPEALGTIEERWRGLRDRFAELPEEGLSGSRALDRRAALHLLDRWLCDVGPLRLQTRVPLGATDVQGALRMALGGVLAGRPGAPADVQAVLSSTPRVLDQSVALLSHPLRPALEAALWICREVAGVLDGLAGMVPPVAPKDVILRARKALEGHSGALRGLLPGASPGFEAAALDALAKARGLAEPLQEVEGRMEVLVGIDGEAGVGPDDAGPAPTVSPVRQGLADSGLVTLPPGDALATVGVPQGLGPLVREPTYLRLARAGPSSAALLNPESVRNAPRVYSLGLCREAYPGRHLHWACGVLNPSRVRALGWWEGFEDLTEGWPTYAAVHLVGGSVGALASKTAGLGGQVDLGFLRGSLGLDEAAGLLAAAGPLDPVVAMGRAARLALHPGLGLGAAMGLVGLRDLGKYAEERMGPRYTPRFLHDSLLYAGPLTIPLARAMLDDKLGAMEEEV